MLILYLWRRLTGRRKCPSCRKYMKRDTTPCPRCGSAVRWEGGEPVSAA